MGRTLRGVGCGVWGVGSDAPNPGSTVQEVTRQPPEGGDDRGDADRAERRGGRGLRRELGPRALCHGRARGSGRDGRRRRGERARHAVAVQVDLPLFGAASDEPRVYGTLALPPGGELIGRALAVAQVVTLDQRRASERARADVVREARHRVELVLRGLRDRGAHGGFETHDVLPEEPIGFRAIDGLRSERRVLAEEVPVADGVPIGVGVRLQAQALEALNQPDAVVGEAHGGQSPIRYWTVSPVGTRPELGMRMNRAPSGMGTHIGPPTISSVKSTYERNSLRMYVPTARLVTALLPLANVTRSTTFEKNSNGDGETSATMVTSRAKGGTGMVKVPVGPAWVLSRK